MDETLDSLVMPFTGERYTPEISGDIELEHLHRYILAKQFASGKKVLDIACGEGYGSSLLAGVALHVTGVDVSQEAIAHAGNKYCKTNLEFRVGSCAAIPLPDNSVDLVVSFETIEHHDQHDAMMAEIKRVLIPGGVLIISSPDKHEYSEVPGYNNPFHCKELYRHEFANLLSVYFEKVEIYGQRIVYGSGIFLENGQGDFVSYNNAHGDAEHLNPFPGVSQPVYLIAVATDFKLPAAISSLLSQPISECAFVKHADNLGQVVRLHESEINRLQLSLAEREEEIRKIRLIAEEQASVLEQQLKTAEARIAAFLSSISWRITKPLRAAIRLFIKDGSSD